MTSSSATEVGARSTSPTAAAWPVIGHLARIGFALVFLWAAISKVIDPPLFAEQIAGYGLTPADWSGWQARLFFVLEFAIGSALLVNYRPRLSIPAGIALMLFFMVVLGIAWANGYSGSCGCFGGSFRTPAQGMLEDVGFLVMGILAWLGLARGPDAGQRGRATWQAAVAGAGVIIGVVGPIVAPQLPLPAWGTAARAGGQFDHVVVQEFSGNILEGDYVVAILDPRDPTSAEAVEPLNALVGEDGVPAVVGVFEGDNEAMIEFLFEHAPAFDGMGHAPRIGLRRFYRTLPVVLALRDAEILAAWHERVPSADEVRGTF